MKTIHRQLLQLNNHSQAGFTIIESLMAIIVVAILLTAIAPVIVLSTATRVQARRVELATQAAKTYTDGVNAGSIDSPDPVPANTDLGSVNAPNSGSFTSCDSSKYCGSKKELYCIDGDSSGKCENTNSRDFIVQAFRTGTATDPQAGYSIGLRVYRADAFQSGTTLKASKDQGTSKKGKSQNTFTGGIGDREAPLVEMTTEIASGATFSKFCSRLEDTNNTQSKCK